MSDMKCPECGHRTELKESDLCLMTICERCRLCGNRNLWDKWAESERVCLEWRKAWDSLETELERTRKALDCAINTLDTVYGMSEDDGNIETYIKCKRIEINGIIKGGDNE